MSKLPAISGRALVKILSRHGFESVRQHGSHVRLKHMSGRPLVTVPLHKEIKPGLLHAILRQTGLRVEDLK